MLSRATFVDSAARITSGNVEGGAYGSKPGHVAIDFSSDEQAKQKATSQKYTLRTVMVSVLLIASYLLFVGQTGPPINLKNPPKRPAAVTRGAKMGSQSSPALPTFSSRKAMSNPTLSQTSYVKPDNTDAGDWFGMAVGISGNTMVVGARNEDSVAVGIGGDGTDNSADDAGAAYVFVRDPDTKAWTQQAYLKGSNTEAGDWFGHSVAICGNTVVVSAFQEDSSSTGVNSTPNESAPNAGAAYVFVRNPDTKIWTQQAYLKASNAEAGDNFGHLVKISGDTVVVTASGEDSDGSGQGNNSAEASGAAYVFVRSGTTWTQQAFLKASNPEAGDQFCFQVAIDRDTIAVGAVFEDSNATGINGNSADNNAVDSGAVYVFVRDTDLGTWSLEAYMKGSNTEAGDAFGQSIAIYHDTIVVGAPQESSNAIGINNSETDNSKAEAGAVYVFVRQGTGWTQQAYIKASNTDAGDLFGQSVAIHFNIMVVGAPKEDSNATGVNMNDADNSAVDSGASYVFVRVGTTWAQQSYLKAGNTEAGDSFGHYLAMSGDVVVVGAHKEGSGTLGVNGDATDNSAAEAGAVYVYFKDSLNFCGRLVQNGWFSSAEECCPNGGKKAGTFRHLTTCKTGYPASAWV